VLERYNGSAWSAVSGSDLVFQVIPNTKGDWVEWPAWAWLLERDSPVKLAFRTNKQVETDLGGSVLFGEGHVICYSPHPEVSGGPNDLIAAGVRWAGHGRSRARAGRSPPSKPVSSGI
jgi:hypothetical protein